MQQEIRQVMNKNDSTYGVHPSSELQQLFAHKPYQGADPESAQVLILGNDANYSPQITHSSFFKRILEYHEDGVKFWRRTGCHHPFLLPDYPFDKRQGGVRYHSNFRKLGFTAQDASSFSFVELLRVPTIGNTGSDKSLFFELLEKDHLDWLESLIFSSRRKFVLVNQTLARSITSVTRKKSCLRRLAPLVRNKPAHSIVHRSAGLTIYNGYSFSASVTNAQLERLSSKVRRFIRQQ